MALRAKLRESSSRLQRRKETSARLHLRDGRIQIRRRAAHTCSTNRPRSPTARTARSCAFSQPRCPQIARHDDEAAVDQIEPVRRRDGNAIAPAFGVWNRARRRAYRRRPSAWSASPRNETVLSGRASLNSADRARGCTGFLPSVPATIGLRRLAEHIELVRHVPRLNASRPPGVSTSSAGCRGFQSVLRVRGNRRSAAT